MYLYFYICWLDWRSCFFPFREISDLLNEEDIDYEGIPWRNSKRAMSRICKHKTRRGNGGNIWVRWRNNNLLRLQIRVKGNRGMGKLCNTSTIHSDLSPTAFFFLSLQQCSSSHKMLKAFDSNPFKIPSQLLSTLMPSIQEEILTASLSLLRNRMRWHEAGS